MAVSNSAAAAASASGKSKKLIVVGALVALLLVVAAAGALFVMNQSKDDPYGDEGGSGARKAATVVPTFLPLENMVVNLADTGGDRFAQVGITLELQDEGTAALVKQYMPSIRNGILMLVSQRSSDELLMREGKEKLAADVLREVTRPLGLNSAPVMVDEDGNPVRRSSPVRRVLFSSFIIQ